MHNDYGQQDITDSMRKGLWASIACTVLVVTLVILGPIDIPDEYPGAPLPASAHRDAQVAARSSGMSHDSGAQQLGSDRYHDAPFVTDAGNAPDPTPQ